MGRQAAGWYPWPRTAAAAAAESTGSDVDRAKPAGEAWFTLVLLVVAVLAWMATVRMSAGMEEMQAGPQMSRMSPEPVLTMTAFLAGWSVMMAAMMLPAVTPAVRLYGRAAALGRVAPSGWFVSGYLTVWLLSGLPAYLLWLAMGAPLMAAEPWALRAAGAVLLAAGLYQLSPLKTACLRRCRSPLGIFMRGRRPLRRPVNALRAGATHGVTCFGCCVGLMAVLVGAAAMQPWWALALAAVVAAERNLRRGEQVARGLAVLLVAGGTAVLVNPALIEGLAQLA